MSRHPLLHLANARDVKQSSEFRGTAEALTGEALAVSYLEEVENAPRRKEAGLEYLVPYPKRLARGRRKNRDDEHLAQALIDQARKEGPLELPGGGSFEPLHGPVPLASAAPGKAAGEDDPNWGVGDVSLLGLGPEDRLAVVQLRFVAKDATRPGVGETPLRGLLTALGHAAIAWANRAALGQELVEAGARRPSEEPPLVMIVATPQYWKLCRKREAQKGAAWIKEHERLAREIEEEIGAQVRFLAIELKGDPGWSYPADAPVLDAAPELRPAWEPGAGRLRPKPRPKPQPEAEQAIEADLTRAPRPYVVSETFAPGDRIEHSTLGLGVVQGSAGPGKIQVLFGDRKVLLVHERG